MGGLLEAGWGRREGGGGGGGIKRRDFFTGSVRHRVVEISPTGRTPMASKVRTERYAVVLNIGEGENSLVCERSDVERII